MGSALIVTSEPERCGNALEAVQAGLANRHDVRTLDLASFRPSMSEAEWKAYHTDTPITDPRVAEHAELVQHAAVLTFVYPTVMWGPPPGLKAWLERVLVPGVAFVLDDNHRVRPNLTNLRAIGGFTVHEQTRRELRVAGDGGKRILLRALRLNAPRRLTTAWVHSHALHDDRFPGFVEQAARRL
ncbi:MAG: NAD(P)H-dependent oxidoreductase [Acidimicrobiia bacterium]|nr:NAD(P)H-dependent oxidoreductase [Acidimicrobiia bacterium]MDH4309107.1 NAD(P)H-dependent oxidoreductase [Acidimicrobiia bacterium]MDH5294034.1 NAD(P)H-dependent oxidoreductase [Acidimicrobiia bacterium]